MACSAFDAFRFATEHLTDELFLRALPQGIMLNLVPRKDYPDGVGFTNSSWVTGRIAPYQDERVWAPISNVQPGVGTCGANWTDISGGWNEVTWGPTAFDLRGEIICEDDLIFGWMVDSFLERYIEAITKSSRMEIENQLLQQYMYTVPAAIAGEAFGVLSASGPGPALTASDSQLTQQMLDQTAAELNLEGASMGITNGWIDMGMSGPRYKLWIGQQASQEIYLNNADFREDVRFADMGDNDNARTLTRLGGTLAIKNFHHIINLTPPRYTFNAGTGTYVRVNTWIAQAATKGTEAEINPNWTTAPYEAAVVLNPDVIHEWIVHAKLSAAGLNYDYKSYFGEWIWRTDGRLISDDPTCYDPQKKLGRHFGQYKHAVQPVLPKYGRWIIFKRCQSAFTAVGCS